MISPRDKGIKGSVPKRVRNYNGIDLSTLPKILSFKAAVAHNEIVLKHTLVAVLILWGIQFSVDQYNDLEMAREYRKKEFLLAPSEITGITPVKPSLVPATYVDDISSIYLSLLGNINTLNIEENYAKLVKHMSDSLRMKFQAETSEWIETVKSENISEVLKVTRKKYFDSPSGVYRVSAITEREQYTGHNYSGVKKEKIELILKIVAPTSKRRWFLQIQSLSRKGLK